MKPYPAYKESGLAWLGEIPEHWDAVLFKRIIHAIKDGTHGSYQRVDEGLPLLSAKNVYFDGIRIGETESLISEPDFNEITSNGFPKKGDLLLTIVGTLGRAFVFDRNEPLAFQRSVAFLRLNGTANPQFYYYLVQSNLFSDQLLSAAKTSAQSGVYMGDIVQTIVLTLPLEEQQAIADYLDRKTAVIDTLIAKKERQIALLQEQKTAVINHAVTKGLNPHAPRKDSGIPWLGQIPAHWELKRLKHISPRILVGVVVNPSSYVDEKGTVPFFVGSDVSDNHISTEKVRRITHESNQKLSKSMLYAGDLVVVRVGEPGVAAVVPEHLDGSNCASMMVVGKHSSFVSEYLCFVMNSKVGKSQVEIVQYGAAQKQFNISHAIDFVYPMPPLVEQQEIANYVVKRSRKFDQACNQIQRQIELLREYRTAVISAAVTGKIDVREAS
jgi:type I restriction enzyme S subunit